MSRFVVCFMKDVLGDNGSEREVCQSSIEIDAVDEGLATETAKRRNSANCSLCATGHCMPTGSRFLGGRFSILKASYRQYATACSMLTGRRKPGVAIVLPLACRPRRRAVGGVGRPHCARADVSSLVMTLGSDGCRNTETD